MTVSSFHRREIQIRRVLKAIPLQNRDGIPLAKADRTGMALIQQSDREKSINQQQLTTMLYTLALILIIAWLLGLISSYTMGGFIHILLVVAIVAVLVRLIQGKNV